MVKKRRVRKAPRLAKKPSKSEAEEEGQASRESPHRYVDPSREGLTVGSMGLREYLEELDEGLALLIPDLLQELEWSEFHERVSSKGRPAYAPWLMVGLVLYGALKGRSTLRSLEELARLDLGAMFICAGIQPDHAVIGRFLTLHADSLSDTLFEHLTREALRRTGVSLFQLSGDGTVIQAASSRWNTLLLESAQKKAKKAREDSDNDPQNPTKAARAEQAQELVEQGQQRAKQRDAKGRKGSQTQLSPTEPEVNILKHKENLVAPGYIVSLLTTAQRFIVGLFTSHSDEREAVPPMFTQAQRIIEQLGVIDSLALDGNYRCTPILQWAIERELNILVPTPPLVDPSSAPRRTGKYFGKKHFRYLADEDAYLCPASQKLTPVSQGKTVTRYRTDACLECPIKSWCTKAKTGRTVERSALDELTDDMRVVLQNPRARARYAQRKTSVEPVFGDLKHKNGWRRSRRFHIQRAHLELAIHAMAHNVRTLYHALRNTFSAFFFFLMALSRTLGSPSEELKGNTRILPYSYT